MTKKSILILIGLINILIASSQTDTITYAECEIDTTPNQYDKLLKYFMVEKEDVNHLWKFNAVDWGTFNPSIAFEQRIKGRSSFEVEALLQPNYTKKGIRMIVAYDPNIDPFSITNEKRIKFGVNLDYRFYYNRNKREIKGKNTNGFSGNYLFFGGGINVSNLASEYINSNRYIHWDLGYAYKAGLGVQRRIGNIGYADIKFGLMLENAPEYYYSNYPSGLDIAQPEPISSTNIVYLIPFIDINLGIALKSLKRPLFK